MSNYQPARQHITCSPNLANVRKITEEYLTELSSQGTDANGRSAYWWVGFLSSQLEHFLAATDPERAS